MQNHTMKCQIVDALFTLMNAQALDTIFVKEIAANAAITRQTFYRHFKDRYDVINWFYDQEVESLFIQTQTLDGIQENLIKKSHFYMQHKSHFKNAYSSHGQNCLRDYEFSTIYRTLAKIVAKKTGCSADNLPPNLSLCIEFFCHGIIGMTIDWINNDCAMDHVAFSELIVSLMPLQIKSLLDTK